MTRVLVVGADAAGMSAAHQALRVATRRGREIEVVAFEMTDDTSYSQCGIPYWVAGDVEAEADLIARTAEEHRRLGVDLRMAHEVLGLDLDKGYAEVRDHTNRKTLREGFDEVVITTGAAPVIPEWAMAAVAESWPGVLPMKTLADGRQWRALLEATSGAHVAVVGGGYIGVEAAESMARRGLRTTMLARRAPMRAGLVQDQAERVQQALQATGVEVRVQADVVGLERVGHQYRLTTSRGDAIEVDLVVLAAGVEPRTALAKDAGLPVAAPDLVRAAGALLPDATGKLADGVWAAGDNCAVLDLVAGEPAYLPLGTHANRLGRVLGENLGGGHAAFPGAVGTAITRAGEVEVARTGLQPEWAERLGIDAVTCALDSTTTSGYMPASAPIHVVVHGERGTGRLLGAQITGGPGSGKRIDVAATALMTGLTAEQVAFLDVAYAPPFSPVWDPLQIACRKLAELTQT